MTSPLNRRTLLLGVVPAAALGLSACGSSSSALRIGICKHRRYLGKRIRKCYRERFGIRGPFGFGNRR